MSGSGRLVRDASSVAATGLGPASAFSAVTVVSAGPSRLDYQRAGPFAAFWATFVMMFREEWRQNIDFARARQVLMFPALVTFTTMLLTVGLRFLVGEGVEDVANRVDDRRAFTWEELKIGLHLPLFLFSLGMGSFAFLGRVLTSSRAERHNYLLATPALQPLDLAVTYVAYYVKEVLYYLMMLLGPVMLGLTLGVLLDPIFGLETPILWTSLPVIAIALALTLSQGLAVSFLGSAMFSRGGWWARLVPIGAVFIGAAVLLELIPFDLVVIGLRYQLTHGWWLVPLGLVVAPGLAICGALIIPEDFEQVVTERGDLLWPVHARLGFLGKGRLRLLVAKEVVDLWRSGTVKKMLASYAVPLVVLLLLAWLAEFARAPIPINLLSYAPFLGFFGFNFYSWLNSVDPPDVMDGLPIRVPELLRAKVVTYVLATTWISVLFLITMAWVLDEFAVLPVALLVMLANSLYIVALSAYLMGLRPNKAIFDVSIMAWFYLFTTLPLVMLFLLSFTQGDASIYDVWADQVLSGGLDAEAVAVGEEQIRAGLSGILMLSAGLFAAGGLLLVLLERKWGRTSFAG